ncbi:DegV family protein [Feifania hominis]|uniref:DegV family protein n=1 Tax=Feifania hominis TaxID=2763660 RepID=A0A926HVB1_9FIRM|nr:DegV family protein [Feifania hominis]MBC8537153.1 DegV family protein [Feifania hominis]
MPATPTYKIMTETNSDLPFSYFQEHDISPLRMNFILDGVTYYEGPDCGMSTREFYDRLRGGILPTTAVANTAEMDAVMEPVLAAGYDLLYVAFSSGLSGIYNTAMLAAMELREKYPERRLIIVDSLSASLGEGLLVDFAVRNRDAGMSIEDNAAWLEANKRRVYHAFTVTDLFHLQRGGRLSKGTAIMGSMLGIKPMLSFDNEGKLVPIGKCRGRQASIEALVQTAIDRGENLKDQRVFLVHGDCEEDANTLAQLLRERAGVRDVFINTVGTVLGTHAGAGVLAVFFMADHR